MLHWKKKVLKNISEALNRKETPQEDEISLKMKQVLPGEDKVSQKKTEEVMKISTGRLNNTSASVEKSELLTKAEDSLKFVNEPLCVGKPDHRVKVLQKKVEYQGKECEQLSKTNDPLQKKEKSTKNAVINSPVMSSDEPRQKYVSSFTSSELKNTRSVIIQEESVQHENSAHLKNTTILQKVNMTQKDESTQKLMQTKSHKIGNGTSDMSVQSQSRIQPLKITTDQVKASVGPLEKDESLKCDSDQPLKITEPQMMTEETKKSLESQSDPHSTKTTEESQNKVTIIHKSNVTKPLNKIESQKTANEANKKLEPLQSATQLIKTTVVLQQIKNTAFSQETAEKCLETRDTFKMIQGKSVHFLNIIQSLKAKVEPQSREKLLKNMDRMLYMQQQQMKTTKALKNKNEPEQELNQLVDILQVSPKIDKSLREAAVTQSEADGSHETKDIMMCNATFLSHNVNNDLTLNIPKTVDDAPYMTVRTEFEVDTGNWNDIPVSVDELREFYKNSSLISKSGASNKGHSNKSHSVKSVESQSDPHSVKSVEPQSDPHSVKSLDSQSEPYSVKSVESQSVPHSAKTAEESQNKVNIVHKSNITKPLNKIEPQKTANEAKKKLEPLQSATQIIKTTVVPQMTKAVIQAFSVPHFEKETQQQKRANDIRDKSIEPQSAIKSVNRIAEPQERETTLPLKPVVESGKVDQSLETSSLSPNAIKQQKKHSEISKVEELPNEDTNLLAVEDYQLKKFEPLIESSTLLDITNNPNPDKKEELIAEKIRSVKINSMTKVKGEPLHNTCLPLNNINDSLEVHSKSLVKVSEITDKALEQIKNMTFSQQETAEKCLETRDTFKMTRGKSVHFLNVVQSIQSLKAKEEPQSREKLLKNMDRMLYLQQQQMKATEPLKNKNEPEQELNQLVDILQVSPKIDKSLREAAVTQSEADGSHETKDIMMCNATFLSHNVNNDLTLNIPKTVDDAPYMTVRTEFEVDTGNRNNTPISVDEVKEFSKNSSSISKSEALDKGHSNKPSIFQHKGLVLPDRPTMRAFMYLHKKNQLQKKSKKFKRLANILQRKANLKQNGVYQKNTDKLKEITLHLNWEKTFTRQLDDLYKKCDIDKKKKEKISQKACEVQDQLISIYVLKEEVSTLLLAVYEEVNKDRVKGCMSVSVTMAFKETWKILNVAMQRLYEYNTSFTKRVQDFKKLIIKLKMNETDNIEKLILCLDRKTTKLTKKIIILKKKICLLKTPNVGMLSVDRLEDRAQRYSYLAKLFFELYQFLQTSAYDKKHTNATLEKALNKVPDFYISWRKSDIYKKIDEPPKEPDCATLVNDFTVEPLKLSGEEASTTLPNQKLVGKKGTKSSVAGWNITEGNKPSGVQKTMYESVKMWRVSSRETNRVARASPLEVCTLPRKVSDLPRVVSDPPSKVSDLPRLAPDSPNNVSTLPRKVFDLRVVPDPPCKVSALPRKVFDLPRVAPDLSSKVSALPSKVFDLPKVVPDLPSKVSTLPRKVFDLLRVAPDPPRKVSDLPRVAPDLSSKVSALPRKVFDLPSIVSALPREACNPPREAHNPPREAHNPPREACNPPREAHNPPREAHNPPREAHNHSREARNPPREVPVLPWIGSAPPRKY
ncbi:uro-adherence factor A-like [Cherax quadricarinatus]|uniref:uro-adherence factor A-like n=1 Tax=Cherax quadricarinatus TaxID=27406 RepID=UPI00237895C8|nr:uncharacterized protein LOC128698615 [Cherax quadricarinatus]XP_053646929.1 uncharacterized protein LOC128698615 [Cherax quadricarinatus]XP_053646930.1 uncharacterized protein LOC128698615 [Cherax quadricarinatus]XP_053646931.1 uncharacterized protein LOC128698615 [Cherax quadricarinatus]